MVSIRCVCEKLVLEGTLGNTFAKLEHSWLQTVQRKFKFINSKRTLSTLIQEWRTEGLNVWNWRQKAKWFHTHSVAVCASTLAASGTLTGQITPPSAIDCCLSICMFFSRWVTWHFQSAPSHVIFSQSDQNCWCFKQSHVKLMNQIFNTLIVDNVFVYFLLMRHLIKFTNESFQNHFPKKQYLKQVNLLVTRIITAKESSSSILNKPK